MIASYLGFNGFMLIFDCDQVLVGKYAGTEIKVGDEEYTIVNAGDILAIIE